MHSQARLLRFKAQDLEDFCRDVFISCGLNQEQATQSAEVMVAADVRGIPSHGIGRLWRYVNGLKSGLMLVDAKPEIVADTPGSLVIDAHGGMGFPVSVDTMNRIIEKAASNGSAFGCVRDSNHFGIAGFYAMQALERDMIGIASTNTAALGLPTFGRQVMYGTNPLAFAAPAAEEKAFVLDMSTTVVTRGKIEDMDKMLRDLRLSPPAAGAERVYFAGQKEFEHETEVKRSGVPLFAETVASLEKISRETAVPMPEAIGR